MHELATIGYQGATPATFLRALSGAGIDMLVDIRAVASSRRPGFSKTKLAAAVTEIGIDYLHLRALGTPADGRAAARAGRHAEMKKIFHAQMETIDAKDALADVVGFIESGRRLCLLCFEAEPEHCHRSIVARAVARVISVRITNLMPEPDTLI